MSVSRCPSSHRKTWERKDLALLLRLTFYRVCLLRLLLMRLALVHPLSCCLISKHLITWQQTLFLTFYLSALGLSFQTNLYNCLLQLWRLCFHCVGRLSKTWVFCIKHHCYALRIGHIGNCTTFWCPFGSGLSSSGYGLGHFGCRRSTRNSWHVIWRHSFCDNHLGIQARGFWLLIWLWCLFLFLDKRLLCLFRCNLQNLLILIWDHHVHDIAYSLLNAPDGDTGILFLYGSWVGWGISLSKINFSPVLWVIDKWNQLQHGSALRFRQKTLLSRKDWRTL